MPESYFKQLAEDLLNIEVNTIVKSEMSAIKLPSSRRCALYDLARDYHLKLVELGVRDPTYWIFAGLRSFEELRIRAKEGMNKLEDDIRNASADEQVALREQVRMLERIEGQSSQMADMFKALEQKAKGQPGYVSAPAPVPMEDLRKMDAHERAPEHRDSITWNNDIERSSMDEAPDLDLMPSQVGRVRKAWEIGTERIQLQTVIQIDGDVTTRISAAFLKNFNPTLLKMHNDAIATSTGFWQNLVKALREMAGAAAELIFGK